MFRGLLIIASSVVAAAAAEPSGFYVVSQFFSDNGAQFYYRVIDVRQDGADSLVRYARIAPADVYCPRLIVQAAQARVRGRTPSRLVEGNNPCAIQPRDLRAALNRSGQRESVFETISFGVVAQCGHSSISLELPRVESVNFKEMESSYPAVARLWRLGSGITAEAFGPGDIFLNRSEEDDLAFQRAGEEMVPELISGRYDRGLAAAVKGNVGTWKKPSFRSLLAGYRGPLSASEARLSYVPQLLNASAYRFTTFAAPAYPPLAKMARVQGRVELHLVVEAATGEVRHASAISGNKLLTPTAVEAARRWRFEPNSASSGTMEVTIEYALRCEETR